MCDRKQAGCGANRAAAGRRAASSHNARQRCRRGACALQRRSLACLAPVPLPSDVGAAAFAQAVGQPRPVLFAPPGAWVAFVG